MLLSRCIWLLEEAILVEFSINICCSSILFSGLNVLSTKAQAANIFIRLCISLFLLSSLTKGFWSGANTGESEEDFQPHVTSYDYDAPITESGDVTEKFFAIREKILSHTGEKVPDPPVIPPKVRLFIIIIVIIIQVVIV